MLRWLLEHVLKNAPDRQKSEFINPLTGRNQQFWLISQQVMNFA